MPKWVIALPIFIFLSGVLGRTISNLGWLLIANHAFYYALFKLSDWSQTLSLYYPVPRLNPAHLDWLPFWHGASMNGYIFAFTLYSTLAITFWGGLFFNHGYLSEGSSHDFNLYMAQFLVWFSAPASFINMNWIYYGRLPNKGDIIALCFFAAGTSIRYFVK